MNLGLTWIESGPEKKKKERRKHGFSAIGPLNPHAFPSRGEGRGGKLGIQTLAGFMVVRVGVMLALHPFFMQTHEL